LVTKRNCNVHLIIRWPCFQFFCFVFSTALLCPYFYLPQMFYKALIFPSVWYCEFKAPNVQSVKYKYLFCQDCLDCFLFRHGLHKFTYHLILDCKFVILILLCRRNLSFVFLDYPHCRCLSWYHIISCSFTNLTGFHCHLIWRYILVSTCFHIL
jgi:hypothetical protein